MQRAENSLNKLTNNFTIDNHWDITGLIVLFYKLIFCDDADHKLNNNYIFIVDKFN